MADKWYDGEEEDGKRGKDMTGRCNGELCMSGRISATYGMRSVVVKVWRECRLVIVTTSELG